MEIFMGHHGRFTKKGRFSNGQMDVFFGENPSKMEVYRWEPFKIHRSHDGP